MDEGIARARREVAAAQLRAANGFGAQAVSRAYCAAFYAAEAALLRVGETRANQSGVVAAVGRLLVRDRGLDEPAGRLLRSLFERRFLADYELAEVPPRRLAEPSPTPSSSSRSSSAGCQPRGGEVSRCCQCESRRARATGRQLAAIPHGAGANLVSDGHLAPSARSTTAA